MMGFGRRKLFILISALLLTALFILYYSADKLGSPRPWKFSREDDAEENAFETDFESAVREKLKDPLRFHAHKSAPKRITELQNATSNFFYAIRTPAPHIWTHIPTQLATSLKRFRHFGIYSDSAAVIGSTRIVDIVAKLNETVLETAPELESYRTRRKGLDFDWGWSPSNYDDPEPEVLLDLVTPQIVQSILETAPPTTDWFILADETSFIAVSALLQLVSDLDPSTPAVYSWGGKGSLPLLLWSRGATELVENGSYPDIAHRVPSGNISSTLLTAKNWCDPLVFFHGVSPWEVQSLFDRDTGGKSSTTSITHSDFYRDYILPFARQERMNWELAPSGPRYNSNYSDVLQPHTIKLHCKRLCEMNEKCLAWQWRENTDCVLETDLGIRRGSGMNNHVVGWTDKTPLVNSGYMIDRIRQLRGDAACDPLQFDMGDNGDLPNDSEFSSEGWLFLAKERIRIEESEVLKALQEYAPT